jgi:DNA polymerase
MRLVEFEPTFEGWQTAARGLLREGVAPADVVWRSLRSAPLERSSSPMEVEAASGPAMRVPARFIELARRAARHHDPERWPLLYGIVWRLVRENRALLADERDPDVRRLLTLARNAPDVVPGEAPISVQPNDDARQPAEPVSLLLAPPVATSAAPFVPRGGDLASLRAAATGCAGCELHLHATQTVFGKGPADARIVLVGEQPGEQEDRQGAPFVGPAGEVLDRALLEVGLVRERLYVTNAVKHFKFEMRGKRRIHQTPRAAELLACRPWIEAELELIKPEVMVCLGATAARALISPDFRLLKERGRFVSSPWAAKTLATLHPSAVLRGEDDAAQARLYAMLVEDLRLVARAA